VEDPLLSLLDVPAPARMSQLESFRNGRGWSIERMCNELAVAIAREFMAGRSDFSSADVAMNWLRSYSFQVEGTSLPEPCDEIYLAFDAGEWKCSSDPPDLDPVEAYTRPRLKEILAQSSRPSA